LSSGLYAPIGISIMYSSAKAKDVEVKIRKSAYNNKNFII
jgi:hypothetical protein